MTFLSCLEEGDCEGELTFDEVAVRVLFFFYILETSRSLRLISRGSSSEGYSYLDCAGVLV